MVAYYSHQDISSGHHTCPFVLDTFLLDLAHKVHTVRLYLDKVYFLDSWVVAGFYIQEDIAPVAFELSEEQVRKNHQENVSHSS